MAQDFKSAKNLEDLIKRLSKKRSLSPEDRQNIPTHAQRLIEEAFGQMTSGISVGEDLSQPLESRMLGVTKGLSQLKQQVGNLSIGGRLSSTQTRELESLVAQKEKTFFTNMRSQFGSFAQDYTGRKGGESAEEYAARLQQFQSFTQARGSYSGYEFARASSSGRMESFAAHMNSANSIMSRRVARAFGQEGQGQISQDVEAFKSLRSDVAGQLRGYMSTGQGDPSSLRQDIQSLVDLAPGSSQSRTAKQMMGRLTQAQSKFAQREQARAQQQERVGLEERYVQARGGGDLEALTASAQRRNELFAEVSQESDPSLKAVRLSQIRGLESFEERTLKRTGQQFTRRSVDYERSIRRDMPRGGDYEQIKGFRGRLGAEYESVSGRYSQLQEELSGLGNSPQDQARKKVLSLEMESTSKQQGFIEVQQRKIERDQQRAERQIASKITSGITGQFGKYREQGGVVTEIPLSEQRSQAAGLLGELRTQRQQASLMGLGDSSLAKFDQKEQQMIRLLGSIDKNIQKQTDHEERQISQVQQQHPVLTRFAKPRTGESAAAYQGRVQGLVGLGMVGQAAAATIGAGIGLGTEYQLQESRVARESFGIQSQLSGIRQSEMLEMASGTAKSRVQWGGDLLLAGIGGAGFLGIGGNQSARRAAFAEVQQRRSAEKTRLFSGMLGTAGKAGLGLAGIGFGAASLIGSGGLAAPISLGLIAGGVGAIGSAFGDVQGLFGDTAMRETGLLGADFQRNAALQREQQSDQARRQIRDSEMQRRVVLTQSQESLGTGMQVAAGLAAKYGGLGVDPLSLLPSMRMGVAANYFQNPMTGKTGVLRNMQVGGQTLPIDPNDPQAETKMLSFARANMSTPWFAEMGMGIEEWASNVSRTGSTTMGRNARDLSGSQRRRATKDLYKMGLSGLGDFSAMSGAAAQISAISGATSGNEDLRQILSEAVKLGFDNSRTGQKFVSSVTNLSQQLGIRNVGDTSRTLTAMTTMMGGQEPDLARAAAGIQGMQQVAGNPFMRSAVQASLVASGVLSGDRSQQAFELGKDPVRAQQVARDIQRAQLNIGKARNAEEMSRYAEKYLKANPNVDPMVRAMIEENAFGRNSSVANFNSSLNSINSAAGTIGNTINQSVKGMVGPSEWKRLEQAKQDFLNAKTDSQRNQAKMHLRGLSENLSGRIALQGVAPEGRMTALFNAIDADGSLQNSMGAGDLAELRGMEAEGGGARRRSAEIMKQKSMSNIALMGLGNLMASETLAEGGTDIAEALFAGKKRGEGFSFNQGGKSFSIGREQAMGVLANINQGQSSPLEQAFQQYAQQTTKLQLMNQQTSQNLGEALSGGGAPSNVNVVNVSDFGVAFVTAMEGSRDLAEPNSSTPTGRPQRLGRM